MKKLMRKIARITLFVFLVNYFMPLYTVFADIDFLNRTLSSISLADGKFMVVYIKAANNTWGTNTCQYPANPNNTTTITDDVIEYIEPKVTYNSYTEAKAAMDQLSSTSDRVASIIGYRNARYGETTKKVTIIDSQYALLDLNVKRTVNEGDFYQSKGSFNTNVYNTIFGTSYINGAYGVDAPLLGYNASTGRAAIKISGIVGIIDRLSTFKVYNDADTAYINVSQLNYEVIPISIAKSPTYYIVKNGTLYHYLSNNMPLYNCNSSSIQSLGPAPMYLQSNTKYYSYDGNYFYNNLMTMINDYKASNFNNAVNKTDPYYNYYQYLPYRSKTSYTATDINYYISNVGKYTSKPVSYDTMTASQSMLYNEGSSFINSQNQFGANAILSFGLSINESGWGRSPIAVGKNNIFGHAAYDYSPGESASSYDSVQSSINYHSDVYISSGYANPTDSRYFGSHFGNKASGMNVKYASDPYWSEKMVSNYYNFDKLNGMGDYDLYQIGIKNTSPATDSLNVRKEPSTSSGVIYSMDNSSYGVADMPVLILDVVEGETVNGSSLWYKIQSDAVLDNNRNMVADPSAAHTYNWTLNYGYVHSSYIKLIGSDDPRIVASDKIIKQGSTYSALEGVIAYDKYDGDITDHIVVTKNDVRTTVVGDYQVIYQVTNSKEKTVTQTITVSVTSNVAPVLNASNTSINQYQSFNVLTNISATDTEDGNITSKITVTGTVNNQVPGVYPITYRVVDRDNNAVTKTINVTVVKIIKPIIQNVSNKKIEEGIYFDPREGISAVDGTDGDITNKIVITGTYDYNKAGTYTLTYRVTNSASVTTTATMTLTVVKLYQEAEGNFYLHSFKWNGTTNKFDISGYLAIKRMNNTYQQTIAYDYILEDVNTGRRYVLPLSRWKQGVKYPVKAVSDVGYNYTDSWFTGSLDLKGVPQGDYNAFVRARSNGKEAEVIFRNLFAKSIQRKATDSKGRGYLFRTNYYLKAKPIEIFIRDAGLIGKIESPTPFDNMFNSYKSMSLTNSSGKAMFGIKGSSFNIMGDYSTKQTVTRQLILENVDTYERTSFNVGYVDNANTGFDKITLRVPDGKDKTRAWFSAKLDLNSLKAGTYAIYIKTKAGSIEDYGELNDISFRKLTQSLTINNKTYRLVLNESKRNRIELEVK